MLSQARHIGLLAAIMGSLTITLALTPLAFGQCVTDTETGGCVNGGAACTAPNGQTGMCASTNKLGCLCQVTSSQQPAPAPPAPPPPASYRLARPSVSHFIQEAALTGMIEIELGKLAAQKGSTDALRQFGQKLTNDQEKFNDELKQIAVHENIDFPDSLDSKHKSRVDKLANLSGTEFDRRFLQAEARNRQRALIEYRAQAQAAADPEVKEFASKTLPTLESRLSTVKDLNAR